MLMYKPTKITVELQICQLNVYLQPVLHLFDTEEQERFFCCSFHYPWSPVQLRSIYKGLYLHGIKEKRVLGSRCQVWGILLAKNAPLDTPSGNLDLLSGGLFDPHPDEWKPLQGTESCWVFGPDVGCGRQDSQGQCPPVAPTSLFPCEAAMLVPSLSCLIVPVIFFNLVLRLAQWFLKASA